MRGLLAAFYLWSLVVAPAIGAMVATSFASSHDVWPFVFAFVILPAGLAFAAARVYHRRIGWGHAIAGTVGAALVGPALWLLIVIALAASGVYDT